MTRHCAISVDVTGVEPAIPGLQNLGRPTFGRTPYDSFLAGESDPGVGGRTPFADCESQRVSGSHKPRPPKKKESGVLASALEAYLTRTAAVVAAIPEGPFPGPVATRTRLRTRISHSGALDAGHKRFHPLSAASCGDRKELTSLSGHAFVRSMVRT